MGAARGVAAVKKSIRLATGHQHSTWCQPPTARSSTCCQVAAAVTASNLRRQVTQKSPAKVPISRCSGCPCRGGSPPPLRRRAYARTLGRAAMRSTCCSRPPESSRRMLITASVVSSGWRARLRQPRAHSGSRQSRSTDSGVRCACCGLVGRATSASASRSSSASSASSLP